MEKKQYEDWSSSMLPVSDALDVINGKWRLYIMVSIFSGNKRFREIEKSIPKLTSKVLAKNLKELEEHKLIKRTVYNDSPVLIEYTLLPYAESLKEVVQALYDWGINHRKKIIEHGRKRSKI